MSGFRSNSREKTTRLVRSVGAGAGRHLQYMRALTFYDEASPDEPLSGYTRSDQLKKPEVETIAMVIINFFPVGTLYTFRYYKIAVTQSVICVARQHKIKMLRGS